MMDKTPKFARNEYLSQVYFYIKRNTDWWLNFQGEIPAYFHGNDSGADNATCFDHAEHVETPELQAFLALQCKFLYQTAEKLGLKFDAVHYKKVFEELSARANDRYFDGKLFVIDVNTGEKIYSNALMPLKVIVLGDKLSKELRDYVVDQIKTRYLGNYGVASEAIDSPEYMTDGYWRGPVWGPDQIIIVSALKDIGETNLAETIKNRYKKACVEFGLGENTDVHTGKALRCKNYCWTACAVLL